MTSLDTSTPRKNIILPSLPQEPSETMEYAVYERFVNHMRHVPNSRTEIKILSAIQFTADMLEHSDAHVAKILVDQGLRAPRMAFPVDFLSYMDISMMRNGWQVGGPTPSMLELKAYWDKNGEDKLAAFRYAPATLREKQFSN